MPRETLRQLLARVRGEKLPQQQQQTQQQGDSARRPAPTMNAMLAGMQAPPPPQHVQSTQQYSVTRASRSSTAAMQQQQQAAQPITASQAGRPDEFYRFFGYVCPKDEYVLDDNDTGETASQARERRLFGDGALDKDRVRRTREHQQLADEIEEEDDDNDGDAGQHHQHQEETNDEDEDSKIEEQRASNVRPPPSDANRSSRGSTARADAKEIVAPPAATQQQSSAPADKAATRVSAILRQKQRAIDDVFAAFMPLELPNVHSVGAGAEDAAATTPVEPARRSAPYQTEQANHYLLGGSSIHRSGRNRGGGGAADDSSTSRPHHHNSNASLRQQSTRGDLLAFDLFAEQKRGNQGSAAAASLSSQAQQQRSAGLINFGQLLEDDLRRDDMTSRHKNQQQQRQPRASALDDPLAPDNDSVTPRRSTNNARDSGDLLQGGSSDLRRSSNGNNNNNARANSRLTAHANSNDKSAAAAAANSNATTSRQARYLDLFNLAGLRNNDEEDDDAADELNPYARGRGKLIDMEELLRGDLAAHGGASEAERRKTALEHSQRERGEAFLNNMMAAGDSAAHLAAAGDAAGINKKDEQQQQQQQHPVTATELARQLNTLDDYEQYETVVPQAVSSTVVPLTARQLDGRPGTKLCAALAGGLMTARFNWLSQGKRAIEFADEDVVRKHQQESNGGIVHHGDPAARMTALLQQRQAVAADHWMPCVRFEIDGFSIVSAPLQHGGMKNHPASNAVGDPQQQQQQHGSSAAARHRSDHLLGRHGSIAGHPILFHCRRVSYSEAGLARLSDANPPTFGVLSVICGSFNAARLERAFFGGGDRQPLVLYSDMPLFTSIASSNGGTSNNNTATAPRAAHFIVGLAFCDSRSPFVDKILGRAPGGAVAALLNPAAAQHQQQHQQHDALNDDRADSVAAGQARGSTRFRYPVISQQQPQPPMSIAQGLASNFTSAATTQQQQTLSGATASRGVSRSTSPAMQRPPQQQPQPQQQGHSLPGADANAAAAKRGPGDEWAVTATLMNAMMSNFAQKKTARRN